MQREEPKGRIATVIDQQVAGVCNCQMFNGQLMFANAGRSHLGIDHQVVADVVEDRAARQRRPARLLAEGPRQRLPRRQAKGCPVDGK